MRGSVGVCGCEVWGYCGVVVGTGGVGVGGSGGQGGVGVAGRVSGRGGGVGGGGQDSFLRRSCPIISHVFIAWILFLSFFTYLSDTSSLFVYFFSPFFITYAVLSFIHSLSV